MRDACFGDVARVLIAREITFRDRTAGGSLANERQCACAECRRRKSVATCPVCLTVIA